MQAFVFLLKAKIFPCENMDRENAFYVTIWMTSSFILLEDTP